MNPVEISSQLTSWRRARRREHRLTMVKRGMALNVWVASPRPALTAASDLVVAGIAVPDRGHDTRARRAVRRAPGRPVAPAPGSSSAPSQAPAGSSCSTTSGSGSRKLAGSIAPGRARLRNGPSRCAPSISRRQRGRQPGGYLERIDELRDRGGDRGGRGAPSCRGRHETGPWWRHRRGRLCCIGGRRRRERACRCSPARASAVRGRCGTWARARSGRGPRWRRCARPRITISPARCPTE